MSKTLIKDIISLTRDDWRLYDLEPQPEVYSKLDCPSILPKNRTKPQWFVKGDLFLCVGCTRRCVLARPIGFVPYFALRYPQPAQPYTLTPLEMVKKKHLLRVKEVAYCLNISERTVRDWIDTGILIAAKHLPKRVLASDVEKLMNELDV